MARPETYMKERRGLDFARLSFPEAPFPHSIQFIFKKYDYNEYVRKSKTGNLNGDGTGGDESTQWANANARAGRAQEKSSKVIELPMPADLVDNTGLSVDGFERTLLETGVMDAIGGKGGGMAELLQGLGKSGMAAYMDDSGADDGARAQLAKSLKVTAKSLGAAFAELGKQTIGSLSGMGNAINTLRGSATNPQKTLFFNGVDLRSFDFSFSLFPESPAEAETIKQIIREIKYHTLPKVQSLAADPTGDAGAALGTAFSKAFLEYPAVVFINLLGVDESHFTKFKPCMVKGFNVSYGGAGNATIAEGGVPAQVDFALSLQEIEIQTAEDYAPVSTEG
jgi:hypothetical protein